MGNGMTVYVNLPGFQKEPINVPNDCDVATFCRKVHGQTGVTLFQGFGFVSNNGATYVVPTEARIVNVTADQFDSTGAVKTLGKSFANIVIDSDAGTPTTLQSLGIVHGDILTFFAVNATTQAANQAAEFNANS